MWCTLVYSYDVGSAPSLFNAMFFRCKSDFSSCFFRISKDLNFRLHNKQHSFSVSINGPRDSNPMGVPTAMGFELGRIGLATIIGAVGVSGGGGGSTSFWGSSFTGTGKLFVFCIDFTGGPTVLVGGSIASCFWK